MPRPNALVDDVKDLSRAGEPRAAAIDQPSDRYVRVAFAGGRVGLLDATTQRGRTWAEVLQSLHESGQPAYVEIDPATSLITEVLLPIRYTVARITKAEDGRQIEFIPSHARHFLRPSHPDFAKLSEMLESARREGSTLLVTETLAEHEIIYARPVPGENVPSPRPRRTRRR